MKKTLFIVLATFALLAVQVSAATGPGSAVLLPINVVLAAANGDLPQLMDKQTTDDIVVVDDFSPHEWRGKGALSAWWRAVEAFRSASHVENFHITGQNITQYDVSKTSAYVVVPVTLTYTAAAKQKTLTGAWTFVLRHTTNGWLISSSTWADLAHN